MIRDYNELIATVAMGTIKAKIAALVIEMDLDGFNIKIMDKVASDISGKISKPETLDDISSAKWLTELDNAVEHAICKETALTLALLPWFDKLDNNDHKFIGTMGIGGRRHGLISVLATIALIKNRIEEGKTMFQLTTPGNREGSLPWVNLASFVKNKTDETKIIETLRVAIALEVDVIYPEPT